MKRVPTLMDDVEFQDFLDKQKRMKSASRPASWIRSLTWPNKNAPLNEAATSGALVTNQLYCKRKKGKCKGGTDTI